MSPFNSIVKNTYHFKILIRKSKLIASFSHFRILTVEEVVFAKLLLQ